MTSTAEGRTYELAATRSHARSGARARASGHGGVRAYRFFRERQLQAAARRLRNEPGPRRTAEEYVMLYFLEKECAEKGAGAS